MGIIKKNKISFNVWKITFINVRIIFSPKDYKKWGKEYLQKNCNFNNWNLKTLVHLIPFLFGFSNMIWSRYQDQAIPFIFSDNLPGIKILTEEVNWETLKFLKTNPIKLKNIKQIDFYHNSCLLKFKTSDKEKLIGIIFPIQNIQFKNDLKSQFQNSYLGSFKKSIITLDNKFFEKNFISDIDELYYNLDEIPKKLENIIVISFTNQNEKNESIFNIELNNLLEKETKKNTNQSFLKLNEFKNLSKSSKVIIPKNFKVSKFNEQLLVKGIRLFDNNISDQDTFNRVKQSSNLRKRLIQHELNYFFYKHGIQTNLVNPFSTEIFPIFSFSDFSSTETLEILKDFLKLKLYKGELIRYLSGYNHPDTTRNKIYIKNLNFLINTSEKETCYKINIPSNLITNIKDNSLVNANCFIQLPITNRKDNFFGINSDELNTSKKNEIKWENFIAQENLKKKYKSFEDLTDCDPDTWFLPIKQKEGIKAVNFEESFFNDFFQKTIKNKNFYIDNSLFQEINLIYHFIPFSENFLLEKNTTLLKIGDLYKRTPTLTTILNNRLNSLRKTNFSFFESWEPISINSWLIITQFSTGFFLLHLVKDLYKDYGKELVEYVLQFASSSGIDVEEIKEQYLYDDTAYRLIRNINKSFKDVAGIDNILLQLGEIVWFLRNNGRSAKLQKSIPSGILLTGPPGTGKTLLVQAIAGEAQVPIIVESGSLLTDPQQKGRGVERLKKIFDQARQLSPCIIFIDEVDTLGEKRQNIIQTPMGNDELIESIYELSQSPQKNTFIPKPLKLEKETTGENDIEYQLFRNETENQKNNGNEKLEQNTETKKNRLSLLTQFLVEMDGLKQRQGVIVIGATNRPNVLDPALIRPGRFDQILNLALPGKQKRIEILKLYGKKLQVETKISWEYLAKRTRGFSAADLAAAMNESTIQSIIAKTSHTIETIERGIDLVTSYNFDSSNLNKESNSKDPFFLSRLSYYQAGKVTLQLFLPNNPPIVVLHLWPRPKNARHRSISETYFSETTNRQILEAQLIAFYAGKASEIIPLYGNKISRSLKRWQSGFGEEDLIYATFLANLLVDKWYFYSMQILIRKNNQILNTRNEKEFNDLEKVRLSNYINNEIEEELEIEKITKLSRLGRYQQRGFGPWWQIQVAKQISEIESFLAHWYRIYLPDPEENILNLEWIPPDEYYHSNDSLKKLSEKSSISFNDLYQIERDYVFHGLILNAFNRAFCLIEEKREFLDYFSDYLLRFEIIRENEINTILNGKKDTLKEINFFEKNEVEKNNKSNQSDFIKIFDTFWGSNSRRKTDRFLKFK